MIIIDIPGYKKLEGEHLVLDYNGTLAIDGKLIDGVKQILERLSKKLSIHIITADTFGISKDELSGIDCTLEILKSSFQDIQKEMFVINLGKDKVIVIGNGRNDALMLKSAVLGIAIIQAEGASTKSILNADIICNNIINALMLLEHPRRINATLRN